MADPVCPYCRMPFTEGAPPRIFCTACGTPHHEDCYRENGGCTVFGCARAPADDPKLQVSSNDLNAVIMPVQRQVPVVQPQAAPAQAAAPAPQYPPSIYGGPLGLGQAAAPSATPVAAPAQSAPPFAVQAATGYQGVPFPIAYGVSHKSRSTFIVLGIFLGSLGVHNFYAGYTGKAVGQLCLSVLTLGALSIVSWVWAIVEICVVDRDSTGLSFN